MKVYFSVIMLLLSINCFCQSSTENEVLEISRQIFRWEVENKIDSVANILAEQFVAASSDGSVITKKDYIERLSARNFTHNAITVSEQSAVISGNSAIVIGAGKFDITVSGRQRISQLSYIEVFIRERNGKPWKMLALKASAIN
ncbi:MAG: nuclear transport factor 2 family protein [Chitinophagaceae bacterium]|nr:nuclear transport factor 2 family protein [Chitinophagaceae bacterium]